MKRLGTSKDLTIGLSAAVLDGRSALGTAELSALRVALNVATWDERGRSRLPGFVKRSSVPLEQASNEDLHDQLLGATPGPSQREVVTLVREAPASTGVRYSVACTKSRIYASTGKGRNWRVLRSGCGARYAAGESPWAASRWMVAQVGDVLLLTNNVDPVLAWPLGAATLTSGDNAGSAAFPVYDLQGLEILRAGVVSEWNGFAFIGDVNVGGTQCGSRVYWSDFNKPQEWAPGGESLAGYVDLGAGEQVLRLEPIGGMLRCYTDKAIYNVEMVGGDAMFKFLEIYRGDLALAYKWSLVNLGDTHLWMSQRTLLEAGQYDRVPLVTDWVHRAAGFIFDGLDASVLDQCPVAFEAFTGLDVSRCYEIAAGWDGSLENAWISWPTKSADANDCEGVRRMTLVLNPRYNRATLVDAGFSAFAEMRRDRWETVRDFLVSYGICTKENLASDQTLLDQREGYPLNFVDEAQPPPPAFVPDCIWNRAEDPAHPKDPTSVAALTQERVLATECAQCVSPSMFVMVSSADLCLKEFELESRWREGYVAERDAPAVFPQVSAGVYEAAGYPTLLQGEYSKYGTKADKTVHRAAVDLDAESQESPGKVYMQVGTGNAPKCTRWRDSRPVTLDCRPSAAPVGSTVGTRTARPYSFPFYCRGAWCGWRLFVADSEGDLAPQGSGLVANEVTLFAGVVGETWSNE